MSDAPRLAPQTLEASARDARSDESRELSFATFWWRVVAAHTVTYFVCGLLAFFLLDYADVYSETELRHLMRPTTSVWVAAGPGLQWVRGSLFALVLWPLRHVLLTRARASLILFGLFVGLSILGPAGPTPGSLEGGLFTTLPLSLHLIGLPEVLVQTAAFSLVLVGWCRRPARWKNVVAAIGVGLAALASGLGVLSALGSL